MTTATFIYNDGGRKDAGYKGTAGDCAARAMAIALEIPYKQAYDELARAHRARTGQKTARKGIYKDDFETVLARYGWVWHPAPKLNGRKARCGDMPEGKVIARMARHLNRHLGEPSRQYVLGLLSQRGIAAVRIRPVSRPNEGSVPLWLYAFGLIQKLSLTPLVHVVQIKLHHKLPLRHWLKPLTMPRMKSTAGLNALHLDQHCRHARPL